MKKTHSPETEHPGFVYKEPEGKEPIEVAQVPEGLGIQDEVSWHMDRKAYRVVEKEDGTSFSKIETLDAIAQGHADAFTINRFRFPPIPGGEWITQHFPILFDNRDLVERAANKTLAGFNREPRS